MGAVARSCRPKRIAEWRSVFADACPGEVHADGSLRHLLFLSHSARLLGGIPLELPALPHIHPRLEGVVVGADPLHVAGLVQAPRAERANVVDLIAVARA